MSFFMIKSILGTMFLLAGLIAIATMFSIMGKQERKIPAPTLRKIHKTAGFIFLIIMLINGFLGLRYWARVGDQISTRAVFHAVLALGLIIILLVKVSIIRIYKNFLRYAPNLGIIVFCLAFVVFGTSAGYLSSRSLLASSTPPETSQPNPIPEVGRAGTGEELFARKCSSCHYADSKDKKIGPGLAILLKNDTLPVSGRPASIENVRAQLERPFMAMPAFKNLPGQQLADLLAYLKTL
jgi:cytochrome b561